ncbi:MAG: hypothetical protein KF886_14590 [Candidatus Hydrogenedentes bacterium]|nr:hypothetical protein [Candidatus Hydrogenedentota bacterium]
MAVIRLLLLLTLALGPVAASPAASRDYHIAAAGGPYFLCDSRVAEDRWLLERFMPPLVKHPENPLITKTGEWEGSGPHMGGSALFDPADGLFKIWYTVFNRHNYDNRLPFSYNVCYAESEDGIAWRKPALGVFDHGADPANNCIRLGEDKTQNIDVMLNPRPDAYPGRFLAIHNQKGGVFVSSSEDGKTFTFLHDAPAIPYHSDTHNNFVFDEVRENWLLFCRPRAYAGDHKRRVSVQHSADLKTWSHERVILVPGEGERPEYYGMTVFRVHDLFFGLRQSYDRADALLYPEIVWSGDGEHWDAIGTHPPALPLGPEGAWDAGMILAAESPVLVGDELRFYYGGFALNHNAPENPCAIGLATAERDRLVGLRPAGAEPGYVLTRPFIVPEGAALRVNATVNAGGSVRAEIRTDGNKTVEGFALDQCGAVEANGFEAPVTWGGEGLGALAGQEVRLRFEVRDAALFTFEF